MFQVKIADFFLSEEIGGGNYTLRTIHRTVTKGNKPMYNAPKTHVTIVPQTVKLY